METVTTECDHLFDFDNCSATISKSIKQQKIVVAFKGTSSHAQLLEQFAKLVLFGLDPFPLNGKWEDGKVCILYIHLWL